MGQQQILFLVLGVCIIGIAVSVGLISLQALTVDAQRAAITEELQQLGARAQAYYRTPDERGGGGGSFLHVNMLARGVEAIGGTPSTLHAEYLIKRSGYSYRTQIVAVGTTGGIDPSLPIRMVMTVLPDSSFIEIQN